MKLSRNASQVQQGRPAWLQLRTQEHHARSAGRGRPPGVEREVLGLRTCRRLDEPGEYVIDPSQHGLGRSEVRREAQRNVGKPVASWVRLGDTLNAKSSTDTFLFPPNFGKETINNFNAKQDVIDLPHSEFADFAAVQADLHVSGHNVVLTLDAMDSITLTHLSINSLQAQNFHFF